MLIFYRKKIEASGCYFSSENFFCTYKQFDTISRSGQRKIKEKMNLKLTVFLRDIFEFEKKKVTGLYLEIPRISNGRKRGGKRIT